MTAPMTQRPEDLRRQLHSLARQEREVQREIGRRVLSGEDVADLRAQRRELRERAEDLAAAAVAAESA